MGLCGTFGKSHPGIHRFFVITLPYGRVIEQNGYLWVSVLLCAKKLTPGTPAANFFPKVEFFIKSFLNTGTFPETVL